MSNLPSNQTISLIQSGERRLWLKQCLGEASLTSQIAPQYRQLASYSLGQYRNNERLVEQAALGLFERDLAHLSCDATLAATPESGGNLATLEISPKVAMQSDSGGLARSTYYVALLTACLGGGQGALSPALLRVLAQFEGARLVHSEGYSRYLGDCEEAAAAARVVSCQKLSCGVTVLGAWSKADGEAIELAVGAMHKRVPGSRGLLQTVVMRTHIGDNVDAEGNCLCTVGGLFDRRRRGEIALLRLQIGDLRALARTLYHEAGHELDIQLGKGFYRTQQGSTPFAQTQNREDYVSDYARLSVEEDFAETHADLILNWALYQQNPTLFFHSQGRVAQKRRFILEQGYGLAVPAPSRLWRETLRAVRQGRSPFADEVELGAAVAHLVRFYRPDQLAQGSFPPGPASEKLRWAAERMLGRELGSSKRAA